MANKILSDEEIFYIPVTSKDDKPSHLNEIARIIRLIQEDTATAQAALTASQKDAEIAQKQEDYDDVYKALQQRDNILEKAEAEIASLQADIEELNILSRCNSEVYDTRIKELETLNYKQSQMKCNRCPYNNPQESAIRADQPQHYVDANNKRVKRGVR